MKDKKTLKLFLPDFYDVAYDYEFQTEIDGILLTRIHDEGNAIVENYDTGNDLYFFLTKYAHNEFIMKHTLIDGNKRMHMWLIKHIHKTITYKEIM